MTTKVPTRQITSGSATSGQVLTADGAGGASFSSSQTVAKAWGYFTVSGSTATKVAGYNFSSVSRSATGVYTITLNNALADTNYAVVALGGGNNLGTVVTQGNTPVTKTTTTFSLSSYSPNLGAAIDTAYCYFVVFGS